MGSRSAPTGTPTSGGLADEFSDLHGGELPPPHVAAAVVAPTATSSSVSVGSAYGGAYVMVADEITGLEYSATSVWQQGPVTLRGAHGGSAATVENRGADFLDEARLAVGAIPKIGEIY